MADQEEDFSSLPLAQRFVHKNWKVRKEAYEAAAKEFDHAQTESDPVVKQFTNDASLWKGAVTDSNVAAHQEALSALCSFLQIAGPTGCQRTRGVTIGPLAEKGLPSTKPAAKAKATEALLLYIELDKADPVIEDLLPFLSHKVPKTVAAVLAALTAIYHAYGCKIVPPKPVLSTLPKIYGHADKNVRAEAQNLTVELYRWLRDGMKPMFWNDLKPVQQTDLEKLFEKVKDEPPPKQERLLRSQQAAAAAAPAAGGVDGGEEDYEDEAEADFEPEVMAINVFAKIPKDFQERLGSSKWKDRKEALDDLHQAVDVPAIEEGPFDEIVRGLAKSMKDANIAVVTVAAQCVELLAKGLKRSFAKYRSTVFSPIIERLKERKQTVTDALGAALDAVCAATSISDCLEETLAALAHKNPQVKLESTRFLIRNLKTTKDAPSIPDVKAVSDVSVKLLADSQDNQRNAAAEVLGVLLKIMGDRIMNVHLDPLDDIRKTKIKEYCDSAEVKSKHKVKAAAPTKAAPAPVQKKSAPGKKPAPVKKPAVAAAAAAAPPPVEPPSPAPLQPKPTARPGLKPPGSAPRGLKPPSSGGSVRKLAAPGQGAAPASPRRAAAPPIVEDESPPPAPKPMSRGLAGRQLAKPSAPIDAAPARPLSTASQPLPSIERIELDELRAESERLRSSNETLRAEQLKLSSQVSELQNQNAQLIEDHTRDVLSIKAKETQLVRARSDAETAEQNAVTLQREVDRLKRELGRIGRAQSPRASEFGAADIFNQAGLGPPSSRASVAVPPSAAGVFREGKENAMPYSGLDKEGRLLSPPLYADGSSAANLNRAASASPRRAATRPYSVATMPNNTTNGGGVMSDSDARSSATSSSSVPGQGEANGEGVESWKRAAEVTQNLKARIELMKQRQQGLRKA